ncbi:hypothetical protein JHD50_12050 [Sulfurimonas sp. MAG313]|nr:hypothetical protein [Sulfurimonas sp. MAG313]MDF1882022.1 hypothetical protein [Sulfurimonas sp. MAG313]
MTEEEKLNFYLERLRKIASENLKEKTAIEALKEAIHYIEGEMIGY